MSSTGKIVEGLIEQREQIRERAEREMMVLQDAIDLLQRPQSPVPPPAKVPQNGDGEEPARSASVADRVREILPDMDEPISAGALRAECAKRWPDEADKVARGIWPAIATLKKRGELEPCDGGFRRPRTG